MRNRLSQKHFTACLLGGAIGDALGAPIEFMSIDQIRNTYGPEGLRDYCEFDNHQGEFTDDTQMTLFTAEGLLRANHRAVLKGIGGADVSVTYQSYIRWLHTQGRSRGSIPEGWGTYDLESGWLIKERDLFKFRAPGSTCLNSLQSGITGTVESPLNNSKGCGAVMRMAPVGLMYDDPEQTFRIACDLGALTHGNPSGYLSAGVFAVIIQQIAAGQKLRDAIMLSLEILQEWTGNEEMLQAATQALELYDQTQSSTSTSNLAIANLIPQLGQGWVGEEALAISLFCCLSYPNDFRQGVLASVNHSGDSDSTGSITGNTLGLINGLDSIPEEWIKNLRSADIVRQIGEDLHTGCKSDSFNTNDEWWDRYPGY